MADKTLAEEQAEDRVNKAAFINDEVMERLHQYDGKDAGVKAAPKVRESYPAAKPAKAAPAKP